MKCTKKRGSDREFETAKFHTAERAKERERERERRARRWRAKVFHRGERKHRLVVSVTRKSNARISKHENTIPGRAK